MLPSCRAAFRTIRASPSSFAFTGRSRASARCLHCGKQINATPVNYPSVAGPPPQPPQASPEDIIARKLRQAELVRKGEALKTNAAKPSSVLKKRFWKDVSVKEADDGLQIMLDSRPIRTATKQILTLPHDKRALATAIAMEWDALVSAQQALKHNYIPMTSLASRAIDLRVADAESNTTIRDEIVRMMMRYLSTDTLLCWAPPANDANASLGLQGTSEKGNRPTSLREKQIAVAEPIIAHLNSHVFPGVKIEPVLDDESIVPRAQADDTLHVIRGWLMGLPAFELAALERGVLATKSLLVAIRLLVDWSPEFKHLQAQDSVTPRFGIRDAAEASTVEVTWQTDMWGEVEDTHDVEKEDVARQLGSVVLLVS